MFSELATLFPTSAVFWNGTVGTLCIRYVRKDTADGRVAIAKTAAVKSFFEMTNNIETSV